LNIVVTGEQTMRMVSIIIPTYNRVEFIRQTVQSALGQTYPKFEVIVVDDGSTDNTQAVLAQFGKRIRYIYQENKGQPSARNRGLQASQGDYLLFLDSDDIIPPNKLELHAAILEARPDFGLVYSGWQYINNDGDVLGEVRPNKEGLLIKDMLRRRFGLATTGAAVVRRDCFERVGLFDESLRKGDDADMWLRIANAGFSFGCIEQPLIQYRIHQKRLSSDVTPQDVQYRFARLDRFFVDPNLPDDIRDLKEEAYSILHYEAAARYYRAGEIKLAQDHISQAVLTCPALASDKEWLLDWIAAVALEPQTEDVHRLLDLIFINLPPEASILRTLRHRAYGRYHVAAAFSASQNHQFKKIRHHILPALMGDPAIIFNRGFLSISLRSLFL